MWKCILLPAIHLHLYIDFWIYIFPTLIQSVSFVCVCTYVCSSVLNANVFFNTSVHFPDLRQCNSFQFPFSLHETLLCTYIYTCVWVQKRTFMEISMESQMQCCWYIILIYLLFVCKNLFFLFLSFFVYFSHPQ